MTDIAQRPHGHIVTELGMNNTMFEDHSIGDMLVNPNHCDPRTGHIYLSILLTHADVLIGAEAFYKTQPRVPVTVDMNLRMLQPVRSGMKIEMHSEILRIGQSAIVGEVYFTVSNQNVAVVHATFSLSPRPNDQGKMQGELGVRREAQELRVPLAERVGMQILKPGLTSMKIQGDNMRNASNSLQGGIVTFNAEYAAISLLEPGEQLVDADIRFLSALREGPAQTHAERIGAGLLRSSVCDHGKDDRVCTVASFRSMKVGR